MNYCVEFTASELKGLQDAFCWFIDNNEDIDSHYWDNACCGYSKIKSCITVNHLR